MAELKRISANIQETLDLGKRAQTYTSDAEFERRERDHQHEVARVRRERTLWAIGTLRRALDKDWGEQPAPWAEEAREAVRAAMGIVAIGQQRITREQIVDGLNALQRVRHGSLWPEDDPYADWFPEG